MFLADLYSLIAVGVDAMWLARFAFLLGMVVLLGCGPEGAATGGAEAEADGLVDSIKSALLDVAETGEMGEPFGEARGMADGLLETDPERGKKLSADLDALEALTDKDERKAKAKEIADSL